MSQPARLTDGERFELARDVFAVLAAARLPACLEVWEDVVAVLPWDPPPPGALGGEQLLEAVVEALGAAGLRCATSYRGRVVVRGWWGHR